LFLVSCFLFLISRFFFPFLSLFFPFFLPYLSSFLPLSSFCPSPLSSSFPLLSLPFSPRPPNFSFPRRMRGNQPSQRRTNRAAGKISSSKPRTSRRHHLIYRHSDSSATAALPPTLSV
jgi:hypothetical protein